ncbi:Rho GTPase activation protein [Spinellus fusiger]|nr:Rho GTPase activation protein [Spinellus fusiger]
MQTLKDIALFLKKRALIEEEYGKQMSKLAQSMVDTGEKTSAKRGTLAESWTGFLKVHEDVGDHRLRFSSDIVQISEDLLYLHRDIEKGRKQIKELYARHEKSLGETQAVLEKAKQRYDQHSEEWEKTLLQKGGEYTTNSKKGIFKSNKTQAQLDRMEEEASTKAAAAEQTYRQQLQTTNQSRSEYYSVHLPKLMADLKAVGDECCVAMRYQLANYAYRYEQALVADAMEVDKDPGLGLRSLVEKIDTTSDLHSYLQSYPSHASKLQKIPLPFKDYVMSPAALHVLHPNPVFGVSLQTLMERTGKAVPCIVTKCTEAIEVYGLGSTGVYRLSGTSSQIHKLRLAFDKGNEAVDLHSEEYLCDVNNIASLLKLWFRELPDPLIPRHMYNAFIATASELIQRKIREERERVLVIHELVNELSDAHYSTLKHLMGHLHRIQANAQENLMTATNIATIFGLTLMGDEAEDSKTPLPDHNNGQWGVDPQQNVCVVLTILDYCKVIFE